MKTIEELQDLTWEELETAASKEAAPVPAGLQTRIAETLAARTLAAEPARRPAARRYGYIALAAAAALTALVVIPRVSAPKDTFDDPYLAYAEVEKAFQSISEKMNAGVDLAREVKPVAEKPLNVLEKINKQ